MNKTIEQWLNYGPEESLSYFMYVNPKRAKGRVARI